MHVQRRLGTGAPGRLHDRHLSAGIGGGGAFGFAEAVGVPVQHENLAVVQEAVEDSARGHDVGQEVRPTV